MTASHEQDRVTRFVRRLGAAQHSRSPELAAARRWIPGRVDHRVAALTCLDSAPATAEEYPSWAQTAKLFTLWHGGRQDPVYGYPGNGIGRWAHQLGVGKPAAERLIARLTTATTPALLDTALSALATQRTPHPPHWETVAVELAAWAHPATRTSTQFAWARDFYSFPPREGGEAVAGAGETDPTLDAVRTGEAQFIAAITSAIDDIDDIPAEDVKNKIKAQIAAWAEKHHLPPTA